MPSASASCGWLIASILRRMRTRAPMCRSVGLGAFFAAVIAMADCSRKAMSKNRPDRGTADSLPGLFAKPRTIVGCTRLSRLNFWIRHADSEWGALTGCWFSGSLAPTLLETVVVASPGLLLDSGGSGRLDDLA